MKRPLITAAVILCAVGVTFLAWKHGYILPGWVRFRTAEQELHEPYDALLVLKHRTLCYMRDGSVLYQTPADWYVSDVLTDDFDQDGKREVLFLVWRQGVYGASHPFWEEPDTDSFYQHLYIFEETEEGLKRQWMSSALLPMFRFWRIEDHRLHVTDPEGDESVWIWRGYGVERTD